MFDASGERAKFLSRMPESKPSKSSSEIAKMIQS